MPKPTQHKAGVLTDKEIKALNIIEPDDVKENDVDDRCFSNASFDFRLGDEYCIPGSTDHEAIIKSCKDPSSIGNITIPPFSSAIISTYENVKLPDNVAGRFDLRIGWALAGLILQVGTQIEPGYEGKLFGMLHNLSDKPISIRYKDFTDRFLTAEFIFTSTPTKPHPGEKTKLYKIKDFISKGTSTGSLHSFVDKFETRNEKLDSIIAEQLKKYEAHEKEINGKLESLNRLEKEMENRLYKNWTVISAIAILLLTVALPIVVTKFTYDKDDFPIDNMYKLENALLQKIDSINVYHIKCQNDSLKETLFKITTKYNEVDSLYKQSLKQITTKKSNPIKTK